MCICVCCSEVVIDQRLVYWPNIFLIIADIVQSG